MRKKKQLDDEREGNGTLKSLCYLYRTFMLSVPYIFVHYIKSCSHKCTLFIVCYLIQFILKIVQHVSNYVTVHLQGLSCLLHQLYTYGADRSGRAV
jgi:hypothetical protein